MSCQRAVYPQFCLTLLLEMFADSQASPKFSDLQPAPILCGKNGFLHITNNKSSLRRTLPYHSLPRRNFISIYVVQSHLTEEPKSSGWSGLRQKHVTCHRQGNFPFSGARTNAIGRWPSDAAGSRFNAVAELVSVAWLEVQGRFDCRLLSPNTDYTQSFLIKFGVSCLGWNVLPIKFIVVKTGEEMNSGCHLVEREGASRDPNLKIAHLKFETDE